MLLVMTGSALAFCMAVGADGSCIQTTAQPFNNVESNQNYFYQKKNLIQMSSFKSRNTNPKYKSSLKEK